MNISRKITLPLETCVEILPEISGKKYKINRINVYEITAVSPLIFVTSGIISGGATFWDKTDMHAKFLIPMQITAKICVYLPAHILANSIYSEAIYLTATKACAILLNIDYDLLSSNKPKR
jgi:hypothetical protein